MAYSDEELDIAVTWLDKIPLTGWVPTDLCHPRDIYMCTWCNSIVCMYMYPDVAMFSHISLCQ